MVCFIQYTATNPSIGILEIFWFQVMWIIGTSLLGQLDNHLACVHCSRCQRVLYNVRCNTAIRSHNALNPNLAKSCFNVRIFLVDQSFRSHTTYQNHRNIDIGIIPVHCFTNLSLKWISLGYLHCNLVGFGYDDFILSRWKCRWGFLIIYSQLGWSAK